MRLLLTAGLVSRRQRVGTVVIALPGDARYSHDVTSVRDLFQYAQDTELRLVYIGKVALTKAMAREFGVERRRGVDLLHGDPPRRPRRRARQEERTADLRHAAVPQSGR